MTELIWKPTKRQGQFLEAPDSIFEILYGGAAGGGKSDALLMLPIARRFYESPRFKGIIFRRTFPETQELIDRSESRGFFRGIGARFNQDKKRWVFPSGASLRFGHLEYDSDVKKYDSDEYNYVAFDELTSFTEYMYLYLFSRCRSSASNLPAIVRSGTNPGGIGHAWVRSRFVEPVPYGKIMLDKLTSLKRLFIQSFAQDNPYLMDNDPQYMSRLQGMAEKDRRAKLYGDWYTFSGQVFTDWREERFPNEPENALHVIDDFPIPLWWPRILAVDWGFAAMTCALWGAISPEERLYVYRERTWKQTKIADWAAEIGRESEELRDCVICQSASQKRGDDLTIAQQFATASGITPRLSGNAKGSRVAGKLRVQEFLRWRPRPQRRIPEANYSQETAERILRNLGLKAHNEYLDSFKVEEPESNLPKVQIFRSCQALRKAIPLCIYDDDRKEDVAEFDGDDPYDTFRYLTEQAESHSWERVKNEGTLFAKEAKIQAEYAQTGDMTSFYRKMERLERESGVHYKPIRRLRRARAA